MPPQSDTHVYPTLKTLLENDGQQSQLKLGVNKSKQFILKTNCNSSSVMNSRSDLITRKSHQIFDTSQNSPKMRNPGMIDSTINRSSRNYESTLASMKISMMGDGDTRGRNDQIIKPNMVRGKIVTSAMNVKTEM